MRYTRERDPKPLLDQTHGAEARFVVIWTGIVLLGIAILGGLWLLGTSIS